MLGSLRQGNEWISGSAGAPATPNIRYWNEPGKGGRFTAFEQPALFVDEVRSCFRLVR